MGRLICSLILLFCVDVNAQIPIEVSQELAVSINDPSIQGLKWNKWTTKNFVICSLEDGQGEYLKNNLEDIKTWMLTRWGFPDVDFPQMQVDNVGIESICRLICVRDPELFKKLFNLDSSKVEIRRDANNEIVLVVGFLLLNNKPAVTLPTPISEIVLTIFSEVSGTNLNWWTIRGMAGLNAPIQDIRVNMHALNTVANTKTIFSFNKNQWVNLNVDQKILFDRQSAALCLMLRKAHGQKNFLWFLKDFQKPNLEAIDKYYNYSSFEELDASFNAFIQNLVVNSLDPKKMPDYKLNIAPEKNFFNW